MFKFKVRDDEVLFCKFGHLYKRSGFFAAGARCLKVTEKVSFNISLNPFFETLKLAVSVTGHVSFNRSKIGVKM